MIKTSRHCDIDHCAAYEDHFGTSISASSLRGPYNDSGWTTRKATLPSGTRMTFDLCPAHSTAIPAGTRILPLLHHAYRTL